MPNDTNQPQEEQPIAHKWVSLDKALDGLEGNKVLNQRIILDAVKALENNSLVYQGVERAVADSQAMIRADFVNDLLMDRKIELKAKQPHTPSDPTRSEDGKRALSFTERLDVDAGRASINPGVSFGRD